MAKPSEDQMNQRLRWMRENVQGAYNAVHPPGHSHAGDHCVNSGTCIIVLCFMNALGKVLMKAGKGDRNRFQRFVDVCMNDFVNESKQKGIPDGGGLLYTAFRCGFVHAAPTKDFAWGRRPNKSEYWMRSKNRLILNIDELVQGFERGIAEFKRQAHADPDLCNNFIRYLTD